MRFIENGQIKEWITEGFGDKTSKINRRDFLAGEDLFDQRALFVICLADQLLRLRLLEASCLAQGAGQTAQGAS